MRFTATFGVVFAAVALAFPAVAAADERYVDNSLALGDNANAPCTSPQAPCRTISFAVSQANPGDTLHVGGGVYFDNVSLPGGVSLREHDFHQSPLTGGEAIVDGLAGTAITAQPGAWRTVSGLTIRGGEGIGIASMRAEDGHLTVQGNRFDEVHDANATQLELTGGSPKITDNQFVGEQDGVDRTAVVYHGAGDPEFTGNTFTRFPRGIEVVAGSNATPFVTVRDNNFSRIYNPTPYIASAIELDHSLALVVGNRLAAGSWSEPLHGISIGGGAGNADGAILRRNQVFGFSAGVSVAETQGSVSLAGDVLAQNRFGLAVSGAATDAVELENVTVTDSGHSEILVNSAPLKLDSTTIGSGGIAAGAGAACEITHSNIEPGTVPPGAEPTCSPAAFQHNLEPRFVAPNVVFRNYRLAANSPLLDRGNPQPAPGLLDVDGELRTVDGDCDGAPRRDIGADERQVSCPPVQPDPPQSDEPGPPAAAGFSLGRLKRDRRRGTATLKVRVEAPGSVRLAGGRLVRRASALTVGPGIVALPVRPRRAAGRRLAARGRLRVRLAVTFTHAGGAAETRVKRARLVRR